MRASEYFAILPNSYYRYIYNLSSVREVTQTSILNTIDANNLIIAYKRAWWYFSQKESFHYCWQFSSFRLNLVDTFPWVSDTLSCSSKLSNFLWVPAARFFCPSAVRCKCCLSRSHVLFAKNDLSYPFLHLFHHLTWYIWRIIMNYMTEGWMIIRNSFRLKIFDTALFFLCMSGDMSM
jgi:hypothetical protein